MRCIESQQAPTKRYPVYPKISSQSQSKGGEFKRCIEPQQAPTKRYPEPKNQQPITE
jgi:hypothetical protein